jgi:hypothetical protein
MAMNCSSARESSLNQIENLILDSGLKPFSHTSLVRFGPSSSSPDRRLLWSGEVSRGKLSLQVFDAELASDEAAMIVTPKSSDHVTLEIVFQRGKDKFDSKVFEQEMDRVNARQPEQGSKKCVTELARAITSVGPTPSVLTPFSSSKMQVGSNLPKCIACTATLGVLLPVVMNLIVGEGFYYWCLNNTAYGEEECADLSVDVTLACELPIIVAGGVIILQKCIEPFCADTAGSRLLSS